MTALDEIVALCTEREIRARRIDVDYASHSVAVDEIRDQLAEALAGIEPQSARTVFFSTVTGGIQDTVDLNADYWFRNIRQTVEFDQAVRAASQSGYRTFIESSPHPALIAGIEDTATEDACRRCRGADTWPRGWRAAAFPRFGCPGLRVGREGGLARCATGGRLRRAADVCL